MIARRRTPEQRREVPTYLGSARAHTVTLVLSDGTIREHRSMAPNWAQAVTLAVRAADDALLSSQVVRLEVEER